MAKNSNIISVFIENADNARFAEDIVGYVVLLNTPVDLLDGRQGELRELTPDFDKNAQRAVEYIEYNLQKNNKDTLREMDNTNCASLSNYKRFAYEESLKCYAKSFDANIFIIFCVNISNMAALFYNRGITKAPVMAVMQIMYVLAKYDTSSGWDALRTAAKSLETTVEVIVQIPRGTHSGEIKPINLLEREIIRYESMKSSLSGENVLTENEEKEVSNA